MSPTWCTDVRSRRATLYRRLPFRLSRKDVLQGDLSARIGVIDDFRPTVRSPIDGLRDAVGAKTIDLSQHLVQELPRRLSGRLEPQFTVIECQIEIRPQGGSHCFDGGLRQTDAETVSPFGYFYLHVLNLHCWIYN